MHLNATFYIRIVAAIALVLGLSDAWRLLGVSHGAASPIAMLGLTGFVYLATFTLALLFAAVGLWMKASWGGLVLVVAIGSELGLYIAGDPAIHISTFGFAVRVVLVAGVLAIFAFTLRLRHAHVQDQ